MLVGDILLSAREAVPDLPGTLPAPATTDLTFSSVNITGGALTPGNYFLVTTYSTLWGETSPSAEVAFTLTAGNNAIQVAAAASPYIGIASAVNLYIGTASGAEVFRYSFPVIPGGIPTYFANGAPGAYSFASPPQGNSAFLLDSGGSVASAQQLFRWLSDALHQVAAANGGVPDTSGFWTDIGRQNYIIPGEWNTVDKAWYDGYPINLGSANGVFRHNALNGTVSQMNYVQVASQLVCELFPQPIRTAGSGTLTAPLTATALASAATLTNWVLPFGMAIFLSEGPTATTFEVVSYAGTNGGLQKMIRGLGGSSGQAWPIGTQILEMNVQISGYRSPQTYVVGQASNTLNIPHDWTPFIHMYLLARYRAIEQAQSEADALLKQFDSYLKSCSRRSKPALGERQIQPQDDTGLQIYPGLSRTFGGILLP